MVAILYVHTRFDSPGGANFVAVETANRLSTHPKFDISIATASFNHDLYILNEKVSLHKIGGGSPGMLSHWVRLPWVLRRLAAVIEKRDIDVVMFHSIPTPYWTLPLQRVAPNVAYVWYAHDPNAYLNLPGKLRDIPRPLRIGIRIMFPFLRRFDKLAIGSYLDAVVSNSQFTRNIIESIYNVDSTVIYPGIDNERFSQKSIPTKQAVFAVGQLNQYKNFDVLIRSMSRLAEHVDQPPSLVIGGTGKYRNRLEEISREEGVTDLVDFPGFIPNHDLPKRYSRALVTVYPPENEPFGLVPIESMAAGTPVIAVDSGGIRETIVDGETGLLVPNASEAEISNALIELINSPNQRERMGIAARERARSIFSIKKTTNKLSEFFCGLQREPRP